MTLGKRSNCADEANEQIIHLKYAKGREIDLKFQCRYGKQNAVLPSPL
jgi:hypothetical protein